MFARGTQLVFSRAYQTCGGWALERRGQVWVLGPLRLFEPFSTARGERENDVDDVVDQDQAEGIEQGTDRRAATGIYFYELCRRDRAASSLMFEPTHRH